MTLVRFSDDDFIFVARHIDAQRWNGWAVPWFDRHQMTAVLDRITATCRESGAEFSWSITGETFHITEDGESYDLVPYNLGDPLTYTFGGGYTFTEYTPPCVRCRWLPMHSSHYCESPYGSECGHDCQGRACPSRPML